MQPHDRYEGACPTVKELARLIDQEDGDHPYADELALGGEA